MNYYRLRFGEEASSRLKFLKAKTGLTPNILARIGFCMSIEDPMPLNLDDYLPDSDREIDRHTLTGPWDSLFLVLVKERCRQDGLGEEAWLPQFKGHMNRGVLLLDKRVKSLNDLIYLLPREPRVHAEVEAQFNGHR